MPNILVVDDELSIRESFSLILEGKYQIHLAASGEGALKIASSQKIDMVYLDIRMPGLNGLETLKRLKEIDPDLEIIMVTAVNEVQKASEAIHLGARDYVVKPFDVNQILKLTEQILRKKNILKEGAAAQKSISKQTPELIGQSDKITGVAKAIEKLKDEHVLILGEPGTEREVVAFLIHESSQRSNSPFKKISLFQEMSLLKTKSLFFGQEKGSSTADLAARSGLLEQAKEGTLFINNVESLPAEILKVLSAQTFSRLGSQAKNPIKARLIAASTTDLADKNKAAFDFFSQASIQIPPLRERISDLPLLINHFTDKYSTQYQKEIKFSKATLELLSNYAWPGNTTELEILIERFFLSSLCGEIKPQDLTIDILLKTSENLGSNFVAIFEREYIRSVFKKNHKDKEKTAMLLGVNPTVLETKLN